MVALFINGLVHGSWEYLILIGHLRMFSCVYFSIDHPCTAGRLHPAAAKRQSVNSPFARWHLVAKIEILSKVVYLEWTKHSRLNINMQLATTRKEKQHREDKEPKRHKQLREKRTGNKRNNKKSTPWTINMLWECLVGKKRTMDFYGNDAKISSFVLCISPECCEHHMLTMATFSVTWDVVSLSLNLTKWKTSPLFIRFWSGQENNWKASARGPQDTWGLIW